MARDAKGCNQTDLSNKLNISQNYISELETGKKTPTTAIIASLCTELDVSADYILGLQVKKDYVDDWENTSLYHIKNVRPDVYSKLRKIILLFSDLILSLITTDVR